MICYDLELAGSIETSGGTSGEGFPGGASHVAVTASKALALSDANTIQVVSSSSTVVITVPTKASVAFPVTNSIGIIGSGSGEVSIAAASGVTINSKDGNLKLDGQHAGATLIKTADDVWTLITTRAEFERLKNTKPETLTDLERAARFIYLQRTAFGGKVSGQHFGVAAERPARFDVTKLIPMLEDLHERLAGVVIENLSYSDFIERYNKPYVLFYLDPPYWNCENDYGKNIFSKDDFEKLAKQLKNIKGSFILSLNDKKEVREIFKDFYIESVSTNYSVSVGKTKKVGEVLISNVDTANISPHKNAA
ncbi:MAG: DNA adenine methylase [Alphaproteobacteria bacterium]|nr:DNA adenine methylase [Alphaproteobacteria bacterium]